MEYGMQGQVALVTGAARDVGRQIALGLAAEGATVAVNYNSSPKEAEAVVAEIVARGGKNVFIGKGGARHSELFMNYLGGLQRYIPEAMAFFAPNVNSYRRLIYGEVSPKNVQWGYDNRTCGLRVPFDSPENMRVETRFAGSDVNPYLAIAATLACGLLGIEQKLLVLNPSGDKSKREEELALVNPRILKKKRRPSLCWCVRLWKCQSGAWR